MSKQSRNFYYYDVKGSGADGEVDISDLLKEIQNLGFDQTQSPNAVVPQGSENIGIDIFDVTEECICGLFGKLHKDIPPARQGNRRVQFSIPENTHFFEQAHFVYFRASKILAIEWNQNAPRHLAIKKYLVDIAHILNKDLVEVQITFKMDRRTLEDLLKLQNISLMHLKVKREQIDSLGNSKISEVLKNYKDQNSADFVVEWKVTFKPRKKIKKTDVLEKGFPDEVKEDILNLYKDAAGFIEAFDLKVSDLKDGRRKLPVNLLKEKYIISIQMIDKNGIKKSEGAIFEEIVKHYNDKQVGNI